MKAKDVDVHYPDGRVERMRTLDDAVASARGITDEQLREMSEAGIFSRRLIASELLDKREKLSVAIEVLTSVREDLGRADTITWNDGSTGHSALFALLRAMDDAIAKLRGPR